jgi:hypothetical protein
MANLSGQVAEGPFEGISRERRVPSPAIFQALQFLFGAASNSPPPAFWRGAWRHVLQSGYSWQGLMALASAALGLLRRTAFLPSGDGAALGLMENA